MTIQIDPASPDEPAGTTVAPGSLVSAGAETEPFLPYDPTGRTPGLGAPGPAGRLAMARLARQAADADEAIGHYREALALDPDDAAASIEAALFLGECGELREAVAILERCVRRYPELPAPRFHLGDFWRQLAEPAKAGQQLRRYLALDPADLLGAGAVLDRLDGSADTLSATYLRALFDQYADDFDRNLIEDLGYRGPQVLRHAVDRCWRAPAGGATVLDLGCGTGLGGAVFRDLAQRLHGVDLSPRMIAKAAARNVYDALEVGDAAAALQRAPAAWDLVVAADVLVYLGDLAAVFAGLAHAVRPGGAFAATVEAVAGDAPLLKPSRRFGHPSSYLQRGAEAAGLRVALFEPVSVRTERGQPVPGHVMVLVKEL